VPGADHLLDFLVQAPIAEHLEMGGEDGGVVVAQLIGDALAVVLDLADGGVERAVEALQLLVDGVARKEAARDAESLVVEHESFADRDAWRYGNALEAFHCGLIGRSACAVDERRAATASAGESI
jgi:hypothetical protein